MDTGQDDNDSNCSDAKMKPSRKTGNKSRCDYINLRLDSQNLFVTKGGPQAIYLFVSSWGRDIDGGLL